MLRVKSLLVYLTFSLALSFSPFLIDSVFAAAGIFAAGGGTVTVGEKFTVTVSAKGAQFDSLQGTIAMSGPVEVVSFAAGTATWLPGKSPGNNQQFVGLTTVTGDLIVARVTLKAKEEGSGLVSVNGVKLAKEGSVVGTESGSTSFKIVRAPVLPGAISVSSSSHPDQGQAYENRTVVLSWNKPDGVTELSYLFDQAAGTTPATKGDGGGTAVTYANKEIGTYYFHIRGKNGDGWGPTTHFKVMIKEPDPKVNETLQAPVIVFVKKAKDFTTNLEEGTVQGLVLRGTGQPGFDLILHFDPKPGNLPAQPLTSKIAQSGIWEIAFSTPLPVGFYTLTAYGQQDKVLTPVSSPVRIQLSIAGGGGAQFITAADAVQSPIPSPLPTSVAVRGLRGDWYWLLWAGLFAVAATGAVWLAVCRRKLK